MVMGLERSLNPGKATTKMFPLITCSIVQALFLLLLSHLRLKKMIVQAAQRPGLALSQWLVTISVPPP